MTQRGTGSSVALQDSGPAWIIHLGGGVAALLYPLQWRKCAHGNGHPEVVAPSALPKRRQRRHGVLRDLRLPKYADEFAPIWRISCPARTTPSSRQDADF